MGLSRCFWIITPMNHYSLCCGMLLVFSNKSRAHESHKIGLSYVTHTHPKQKTPTLENLQREHEKGQAVETVTAESESHSYLCMSHVWHNKKEWGFDCTLMVTILIFHLPVPLDAQHPSHNSVLSRYERTIIWIGKTINCC